MERDLGAPIATGRIMLTGHAKDGGVSGSCTEATKVPACDAPWGECMHRVPSWQQASTYPVWIPRTVQNANSRRESNSARPRGGQSPY